MVPQTNGRGGYWGRINEAYTVGMGQVDRNDMNVPYSKHDAGGQNAMKAVSQVLGIQMDYWISLDFVGFKRFIDAIGGVNVNVERAFTDTEYPNNDDADIDPSYRTVHFDAGLQHMDGETAITFARSRKAPEDGSDFGRARRQQLLMSAVKDQVVSVETIPKLFGILDALEGHIRMSFSFTEAKDLLGWGQEQAMAKRQFAISSGVIDSNRLLYGATSSGGASILLPRAGQGNYREIQSWVSDLLATSSPPKPSGTPGTGTPVPGGALPTTTR
jgi:LCP family protein required for cell wall assembly